uniref:LIM zinc-binding domain-containing protein n=1 Tax=Timema tahoe TaxID=61484 RepID=A0A7R9IN39_9NEOP|nr:unnamed protein product [Timema tahoe]
MKWASFACETGPFHSISACEMDASPPEVHGSVLGTPLPTYSSRTSRHLCQASIPTPDARTTALRHHLVCSTTLPRYVHSEAMGTFLTPGYSAEMSAFIPLSGFRHTSNALDLFWHEDCLKCGCCDCRLGEVGSTLYTKANLILCKRDYLRLFGTTGYCAACNKVIPAFEMVMRAKSNVYHLECFACQQCNHRFCVGDRFYLCDNKILCEYDYEERLVFANMAYNPTSLAHIRRQVSTLQRILYECSMPVVKLCSPCAGVARWSLDEYVRDKPSSIEKKYSPAGDHINSSYECVLFPPAPPTAGKTLVPTPQCYKTVQPTLCYKTHTKDDGSSGYGSPDSETFDTQCNQQV